MAKVVCSARHPIDLSDGRTLGPGDVAEGIDIENDEHNGQLAKDGLLAVLEIPQPPAGPVPDNFDAADTADQTGGNT